MSINAMQRAALAHGAQGLGFYGHESQGLGSIDLNAIINRGFDFGNLFIQSKYAKDAAKFTGGNNAFQLQPTGGNPDAAMLAELERLRALNAGGGGGGVGFGIDSQGLRLSDGSHIGWPIIGIVGLGIYLVQSPGFTKRR